MINYKDLHGNSGVVEYDIDNDFIKVRFRTGSIYVYTYRKPGRDIVEVMKRLAEDGKGLSTYISQVVKKNYDYIEY